LVSRSVDRLSFAKIPDILELPDLLAVQHESFQWFLDTGLQEILEAVSPIESFNGALALELVDHIFGEPLHDLEECKERDTNFSRPLYVTGRFINRETGEIKESPIFLGDFPMMTEKGTFVINGTERVIVSQLVRSPGAYFDETRDKTSDRMIYSGKMIPGRGAWLEFDVDKRETIGVRVDRKRRQYASAFIRALGIAETDEEILELFGHSEAIKNTLERDTVANGDEALLDLYRKLRPGEPTTVESARGMVNTLFRNPKRYDLTRVGRYKLNAKFGNPEPEGYVAAEDGLLSDNDIVDALRTLEALWAGNADAELSSGSTPVRIDDIDHFGNRRVRTVGELIQNQIRLGLTRLERVVRERMSTQDADAITPQSLVNIRPVVAAIKEFFGTSQLSQFMDQPNPLAALTHRRRLSALGPGGLSRERAGFEVRDVHPSHYGRMCPIETPEGPNIGLIGYLSSYAKINSFGFIETPYRVVKKARVTNEIVYLTATGEEDEVIAQANAPLDAKGKFVNDRVLVRKTGGEVEYILAEEVDFMDVSPKQMVSVSTALIPFLEHDDANRALMGANMQRQAVPLVTTDAPLVGTGMEARAARDSGFAIVASHDGEITEVTGDLIVMKTKDENAKVEYKLEKFSRSNQGTCINQKPLVKQGDKVKAGQVIADGPSSEDGELALGRNLLVAFMPWNGLNYEDAIVLSERLVRDDILTSIHIQEHEVDARDTKLGAEEITRDIPQVSEEVLLDLDDEGIIRVGADVGPGDYLVGKVTPKGETELTPEERLLRAIFGEKSREVRDTSLKVPHGEAGKVIDVKVFRRDDGYDLKPGVNELVRVHVAALKKIQSGDKLAGRHGNKGVISRILPVEDMPFMADGRAIDVLLSPLGIPSRMNLGQILETHLGWAAAQGWESFTSESPASKGAPPWQKTATPVFDGAHETEIIDVLKNAHPSRSGERLVDAEGKAQLFDGRTGEPFDARITVGYMYILKLNHLVDSKIHARSTGPYSMITQQPLGGKAQFGGQRFGEMEVWALEAYGAAYALQEILTIKSDDVQGRVKVYEAIVKGENIPEPGIPESFKVLVKEMQSLCLNVEMLSAGEEVELRELEDDTPFRGGPSLGIDMSRNS
jgi:DNA-directed RNA polymerase subunit beta